MSNPYQSPQPLEQSPDGPGGEDREKLKRVARYQRLAMYALMANIGLNVLSVVRVSYGRPGFGVSVIVFVAVLVVVPFSMAAMYLLTSALHNPIIGVLCAVSAIVPCIAMFILLVINQYATNYLTDRGVKVGFLGADPHSIGAY